MSDSRNGSATSGYVKVPSNKQKGTISFEYDDDEETVLSLTKMPKRKPPPPSTKQKSSKSSSSSGRGKIKRSSSRKHHSSSSSYSSSTSSPPSWQALGLESSQTPSSSSENMRQPPQRSVSVRQPSSRSESVRGIYRDVPVSVDTSSRHSQSHRHLSSSTQYHGRLSKFPPKDESTERAESIINQRQQSMRELLRKPQKKLPPAPVKIYEGTATAENNDDPCDNNGEALCKMDDVGMNSMVSQRTVSTEGSSDGEYPYKKSNHHYYEPDSQGIRAGLTLVTVGCLAGVIFLTSLFVSVPGLRGSSGGDNYDPNVPRHHHHKCDDLTPAQCDILEMLIPISHGLAGASYNDPQRKAFDWLLTTQNSNNDGAAGAAAVSQQRLVQMYALATLYYATDGTKWTKANNWLIDGNECGWTGIRCANSFRGSGNTVLESVTFIDLKGMGLQGNIPSEIGALESLENLWLHENKLNGQIPDTIINLKKLEELLLNDNDIFGTIPLNIGDTVSLKSIDLSHNNLSYHIPNGLGNLRDLIYVDLSNNSLSGEFPMELANLNKLETLLLDSNKITGEMRGWIGGLKSIKIFSISDNEMEGSIHSDIGLLSNLEVLNIADNDFTDLLPDSISKLLNLREFNVSLNHFEGLIPPSFARLDKMEIASFDNNSFSGPMPGWFDSLNSITDIRLQNNLLTGDVPSTLCQSKPDILSCDCGGDNPRVICTCCKECFG